MDGELLYKRKFLLKTKTRIYQSCMRLAMLCRSEALCLRENRMAILRIEKALMRAMCGAKQTEKRMSQELGLNTLDGLARANGVQWYGHVLRRNNSGILRRALDFEVVGKREHE